MGKRGPKKKIPYLEALDGNPSKREIEALGIDALGEPFIAEHLMDDARGCIEVIKRSMPPKVYSALDSFLLAAFGMAWAIHKQASLEVSNPEFKFVSVSQNGRAFVSPWLGIISNQAMTMASLGDRLGLDPKSRATLKLPNARQQKSKFDGLTEPIASSSSSSASQFPAASAREGRLS